ncbi:PAS domain-containing protein [Candidatus Symbiopectobacterium sp. PLON1]|uniref:PAS domain-containing protein n=1 Tax=Candidatus Symbiopectobacterium sp. PLON1 TaxID=2794575 RepID=UPI0020794BC4|nr:PAS domain-containing protein [Candidatus Symbiopectobacterium sp. PLON1]
MGEPHNIIRHPDMPPSAFADMWNTLKKGNIWTGIVKNRRKNGEFYWVKSSTTPLKRAIGLRGTCLYGSPPPTRKLPRLKPCMTGSTAVN